jgi:hypothetical protein
MMAALGVGVVGMSASIALGNGPKILLFTIALLGLCLLLFPTLTVVVERERLLCFFGCGLIRREIRLSEIQAVSVVRNRWTSGWGLRLIPGGWMWNVSGLDAVELRLRNGRRFRIGTDQPAALRAAIAKRVGMEAR